MFKLILSADEVAILKVLLEDAIEDCDPADFEYQEKLYKMMEGLN